jgi:CheY-like chemotaxis protein
VKLSELTAELLQQAVDLYLEEAYRESAAREAHRVVFDPASKGEALLTAFRDETEPTEGAHHFYSLRLGSDDYPHMKMSVWEAFYHGEYVLNVDAHDGFRFDCNAPDYAEWMELKNRNRLCKLAIEDAWFKADLPTMRRLKEHHLTRSDHIRAYRGYHVLLVDDDADAAAIVSMILESAGLRCCWARTVREALDQVADPENHFALALVDIVMVDGNGLDVLHALRAEPRTQHTPAYLTSAMNRDEVEHDRCADGYLRKPFNASSLIQEVEKALLRHDSGETVFLDENN